MNAGVIMGRREQGPELLLSAAEVRAGMDGSEMPKDAVPAVCGMSEIWFLSGVRE